MLKKIWNQRNIRIVIKLLLCLLGLLLMIVLFKMMKEPDTPIIPPESEPVPEEPVIEVLSNVWIQEATVHRMLIFDQGEYRVLPYGDGIHITEEFHEQIADIILEDGVVTFFKTKTQRINGRILSVSDQGIEVEGIGQIPLSEDVKGYQLYDSLQMSERREIRIGYDFTDLIVEDNKVCAFLVAREEKMDKIRVLIRTSELASTLHEEVIMTADTGFTVNYLTPEGCQTDSYQKGEELLFDASSPYLAYGRVKIEPNELTGRVILKNVTRKQKEPAYRGTMEIMKTPDGLAVINELSLEEYLYHVVPSEMPSSYPKEALKVQAICARTYAYGHIIAAGLSRYGAHVDDSANYQVYHNIDESNSTTEAVKETCGQLIFTKEHELAGAYYYSTSCGVGTDANVWKTKAAAEIDYLFAKAISKVPGEDNLGELLKEEAAFDQFISTKNEDDFEVNEGWYRWTYQVESLDSDIMLENLKKRYDANESQILTLEKGEFVSKEVDKLGDVLELEITARGVGGTAEELLITGSKNTFKVITGHNIRSVLTDGTTKIIRQNNNKVNCPNLLPSAFFVIRTSKKDNKVVGYTLIGGGFGHGVGMSQNGAKNMALSGYDCESIVKFFYVNCEIVNIYETKEEEEIDNTLPQMD